MYDLGAGATVIPRVTWVQILWDKHKHGRNIRKNPLFTDDTSCPLCGGADSQYRIIMECSHRAMQASDFRQKHIALLDIRKRDLRKKRNPISPLFETYLAFATTLRAGEVEDEPHRIGRVGLLQSTRLPWKRPTAGPDWMEHQHTDAFSVIQNSLLPPLGT